MRRDLGNRASPVNRAHMKRPLVKRNRIEAEVFLAVEKNNNGKDRRKKTTKKKRQDKKPLLAG